MKTLMNSYWKKIALSIVYMPRELSREAWISEKTTRLFDFIWCQAIIIYLSTGRASSQFDWLSRDPGVRQLLSLGHFHFGRISEL